MTENIGCWNCKFVSEPVDLPYTYGGTNQSLWRRREMTFPREFYRSRTVMGFCNKHQNDLLTTRACGAWRPQLTGKTYKTSAEFFS